MRSTGCSDVVFPGADGTTGATPIITKTTTTDPEAGGMPMEEGTAKPVTKPVTSPLPATVVRRGSLSFFTRITNDWARGLLHQRQGQEPLVAAGHLAGDAQGLGQDHQPVVGPRPPSRARLTVRGRAYNARLAARRVHVVRLLRAARTTVARSGDWRRWADAPSAHAAYLVHTDHREKARWALDRAGLAYREERHVQGIHQFVARRAGGGTTLPVLVDGSVVLTSSESILRYAD